MQVFTHCEANYYRDKSPWKKTDQTWRFFTHFSTCSEEWMTEINVWYLTASKKEFSSEHFIWYNLLSWKVRPSLYTVLKLYLFLNKLADAIKRNSFTLYSSSTFFKHWSKCKTKTSAYIYKRLTTKILRKCDIEHCNPQPHSMCVLKPLLTVCCITMLMLHYDQMNSTISCIGCTNYSVSINSNWCQSRVFPPVWWTKFLSFTLYAG